MAGSLDFFFSLGSTYTYLTAMRIEAVAEAADVTVRWRPFSVRTIMREQNNIPFTHKPIKTRYMWRDIERRAARHGIAFAGLPHYPNDGDPIANQLGIIAADEGWCPAYTKAVYRNWFLDDKDPGDRETLRSILLSLGKDPVALLERAGSPDLQERYAAQTDVARQAGIFGSPTFMVGEEMFWGDDRLEEALDWCLRHATAAAPGA
ncbi:MAG: 2-hydroxychromene-2-carboxylate isomerase [Acetobacteraceae bacterium]|jgi:2-hydroxychromene-2-carboxylate isomerase